MFNKPHIDFIDLPCERLPREFDGISLLHLSDLHMTRWTGRLEKWRSELAKLSPDILAITGDLGHRSWHWKTTIDSVQRLLEPLTPRLGTFFILGNHDSIKLGPVLAETTDKAGTPRRFLQNETVFLTAEQFSNKIDNQKSKIENPLTIQHSSLSTPATISILKSEISNFKSQISNPPSPRLALVGIHQHRRIDTDIPAALRHVRPNDFKLMLLHYPDLVHPAAAAGADICLAGHTHGGQICWPDGRPLFRQDTLSAEQCTGVHRVNGTWMVVNRGIGAAGFRMRLFCPPHAVFMTLRATSGRVL